MAKRVLDFSVALLMLLALSPLLLVVAIAVRLDSPGPVLFRQQRVARGGRIFEMLKFRSMRHTLHESGRQITVAGDCRITRVGALLRRAKLDEVPQLVNVLRGDMSLVGPRPEVPKYVAKYPPGDRELVLSVRPGITDIASIHYFDEGVLLAKADDPERMYVEEILPKKLAMYVEYVRGRSMVGDLVIIARTVGRLFRRRGNVNLGGL